MKRVLILPLLFLSSYFFAQDVEVKWGTDYGKKGNENRPIGINKDGSLLYPTPALVENFQKFYCKYKILNKIAYLHTANHTYAEVSSLDKSGHNLQLTYIEVDEKGNAKSGVTVPILQFSIPYDMYDMDDQRYVGIRGFIESNDRKTVLNVSVKSDAAALVNVYDESLKLLWSKEITLPITSNKALTENAFITNSGKVILTGITSNAGNMPDFSIYAVTSSDVKHTKLDIGSKGKVLAFKTNEIDEDNVLIAGVYNNQPKRTISSAGTFCSKLNVSTCSIASTSANSYSSNTISQIGVAKDNTVNNLYPNYLLKSSTGQFVLVLNDSRTYTFSKFDLNSPNMRVDVSTIHEHNVSYTNVLIGFTNEFKTAFETPILNTFQSLTHYLGTDVYQTGDNIILLYNSNEGNDRKHSFKYASCDLTGKATSQKDIPFSNKDYFFVPRTSSQVSDNKFIVGASPSDGNGFTPVFVYGVLTVK